ADSVVYQLNDKSFNYHLEEIADEGKRGFDYDKIDAFGDFEIRATVWYPAWGECVIAQVVEALRRHHGSWPSRAIRDALDELQNNAAKDEHEEEEGEDEDRE